MSLTNFEQEWQEVFSNTAVRGGEDYQISLWFEQGLKNYIRYFLKYFDQVVKKDKQDIPVLDLGCGPGTFSRVLDKKGFSVFAVDYSAEMIERAKKKCSDCNISFLRADAYNLPYQDNFFDIVICLGVFQTIEKEQEAIREIKRVLKKDGRVFITTLNKFSFGALLEGKHDMAIKRYSPWQFKREMEKHGFGDVKIKGVYFFPKKIDFLSDIIFKLRIYKFFNLFFRIFSGISHSFHIEAKK